MDAGSVPLKTRESILADNQSPICRFSAGANQQHFCSNSAELLIFAGSLFAVSLMAELMDDSKVVDTIRIDKTARELQELVSLVAFFTLHQKPAIFCRIIETDSETNTSARNNAFVQGSCLVLQCKTIAETNTTLGTLARTVWLQLRESWETA